MFILDYIRYKIVDCLLSIADFFIGLAKTISDDHSYSDRYGEKDGYKGLVQCCEYKIGKFTICSIISAWDVGYWVKKLGYKK